MGRSWRIVTAFGIPVYVHWSFFLLVLVAIFLSATQGIPLALTLLMLALLFTCVVLHEFGHALMARHYGIPTRDITLLPIGGVARLERMSEKPWEEVCIALAGPAVNVVIALSMGALHVLGLALLVLSGADTDLFLHRYGLAVEVVDALLYVNLVLLVFNMIPAFPMDGGRVFRALLSRMLGLVPATEIAALVGMALAGVMALVGLRVIPLNIHGEPASPLLAVVGMFVLFAGQQELMAVRQRAGQRRTEAVNGPLLQGPFIRPSSPPPEPNFSGFTWDRQAHVWIEWRNGRPIQACWVGTD
jgi:Zn-dependent protease